MSGQLLAKRAWGHRSQGHLPDTSIAQQNRVTVAKEATHLPNTTSHASLDGSSQATPRTSSPCRQTRNTIAKVRPLVSLRARS
jgi:hypothetical protein